MNKFARSAAIGLIALYGIATIAAGFARLRPLGGASVLAGVSLVLAAVLLLQRASDGLSLLVVALLLAQVAALLNGRMQGRIHPQHHAIRLAPAVLLAALGV
jgi:hypothetical protein